MKQFAKSILALGITSALSFALISTTHAATYRIIEKNAVSELKYTYAQQQNNNGVMAISGKGLYNFPVQFDYLDEADFKAIKNYALSNHERVFGLNELENYDALTAGKPTANDLTWVRMWLENSQATNFEYQKVGNTVAMINAGTTGATTDAFTVFDKAFTDTDQLTRSTVDIISGVTDAGLVYGTATAPYLPLDTFTDSNGNEKNYWDRDFGQRGFFSFDNGAHIFEIMPSESRYGGGISAILDVNENNTAVGYMSYKLDKNSQEYVLDDSNGCADGAVLKNIPYSICEQRRESSMYHTIAYKAELSDDGSVVTEQLGLLVNPHKDDERRHFSYATAINDDGVAVGYATGWYDENVTAPKVNQRTFSAYAVMYKDGDVFDFNQKNNIFVRGGSVISRAHDINNNGVAVGFKYNERGVRKMFYVDTRAAQDDMEMVFPSDFFATSASAAYAINEQGLIVGEGEIESHNSSANNPRRTAAFLYDMNNDTFSNVNDLISCDSPYNVIQARHINDNNVISASAVIKVNRYDDKGELVLDENGDPEQEDVIRAVILEPISGGKIDECTKEEAEEKVKRQGAGFGFIGLLLLFGIARYRKRSS